MEGFKRTRGVLKGQLTRFSRQLESGELSGDLAALRVNLESKMTLLSRYDEIQTKIEELCETEEELNTELDERGQFEALYFRSIGKTRTLLDAGNADLVSTYSTVHDNEQKEEDSYVGAYLPKLQIPKFDGNYSNWVKFRDTFNAIIDKNPKLSNIQKFAFLNEALEGKAARVIASLGVSEDNYQSAWKKISDRYEDTNTLIFHHVSGLFEISKLNNATQDDLRFLIDTFDNHLAALKSLKEPTERWDTLLVYLLATKLDPITKDEWEKELATKSVKATYGQMLQFLEKRCKFLEKTTAPTAKHTKSQIKTYFEVAKICPLCSEGHPLYACNEFKALPPTLRVDKAREWKLCFNCLYPGHRNMGCKLGPCRICGKKHNTLLHLGAPVSLPENTSPTSTATNTDELQLKNFRVQSTSSEHTMLGTAIVLVYDSRGNAHECRALLDSCSQAHLMTYSFCEKLNLSRLKISAVLAGIGQASESIQSGVVVKVRSCTTEFCKTITCLLVDRIDDQVPSSRLQTDSIELPKSIQLADPDFFKSRPVDMLIGTALFYELLCVGQIRLRDDQPLFQKTVLGWIVAGRVVIPHEQGNSLRCNVIRNKELDSQLEKFWAIENCHAPVNAATVKADFAYQHFQETTTRDETGRFIVSIPFKIELLSALGDSKDSAYRQFLSLERKLTRNSELKRQYVQFMKEYEDLGHMVEVSNLDYSKHHYFIPHHAVFKQDSTTTKLRVVFNGSAKTSTGLSLNDVQFIRTPDQRDLISILLSSRRHPILLSADIRKMYRQILVKEEQRMMQLIYWRDDPSKNIRIMALSTVTYGTGSAPDLAISCLRRIATMCKETSPHVSEVLLNNFYVDDLLVGVDSLEEAKRLKIDLTRILAEFGFSLHKWASNEPLAVVEGSAENNICIYGDKDPKTLGLIWDPSTDSLKYRIQPFSSRRITKREVISVIAQVFDPLGLVGPVIVPAKIIMQRLWTLNMGWDESLPQELHSAWEHVHQEIVNIGQLGVERCVIREKNAKLEYHGFCDASEKAYGASIYVCSISEEGIRSSNLLCAKSRVAPLKAMTIPRLELLGALLLAQLAHKVQLSWNTTQNEWYYWTDSMVVLAWIKAPSHNWKTFVANRVGEIQELTNGNWSHVVSEKNPADILSRGTTAKELRDSSLWWHGPDWLITPHILLPTHLGTSTWEMDEAPERRTSFFVGAERSADLVEPEHCECIFKRFSSFTRMIRTIGYIRRFIQNCKISMRKRTHLSPSNKDQTIFLSTQELNHALNQLLQRAQADAFPNEISALKNGKDVSRSSQLIQLNPFLDSQGLLRVGGRLENANISFDQKHPIILGAHHHLTHLLIKYEHQRLLHAGCQSVIASLRKRYWPLSSKNITKKIIRECIPCFRAKPIPSSHLMGNLPASRLTPLRAFHTSGVDYAGPIFIKERSRARVSLKAYLCIFICFTTKAVHIELAVDLSTEAFLNCLKRFISRRGLCKEIYSDNGLNFVGAKNDMDEMMAFLDGQFKNDVTEFCSLHQVSWHFIPPHAPHFGGLWESAVKSAKHHLKRVVGETRLTFEELYTVLAQIEACLNSRPLSPLSNDPNDLTPLTPGHFLIGDSLLALPQLDVKDVKVNRLRRFHMLQQMVQHFWRRWHVEYLNQLQGRQKWFQKAKNLQPGMLVLVKDENTPPLQWPLGRIVDVHPGRDGTTRVVSILVSKGTILRPVAKVCALPIDSSSNSTNKND